MSTSTVTDEQLREDLQYLLDCDLESLHGPITHNAKNNGMEEELSMLIISAYRPHEDHQFVLVRYITPEGERGFGELCYMVDNFMTMRAQNSIESVIENLTDQGRDRVSFFVNGIKDGSLVDNTTP